MVVNPCKVDLRQSTESIGAMSRLQIYSSETFWTKFIRQMPGSHKQRRNISFFRDLLCPFMHVLLIICRQQGHKLEGWAQHSRHISVSIYPRSVMLIKTINTRVWKPKNFRSKLRFVLCCLMDGTQEHVERKMWYGSWVHVQIPRRLFDRAPKLFAEYLAEKCTFRTCLGCCDEVFDERLVGNDLLYTLLAVLQVCILYKTIHH